MLKIMSVFGTRPEAIKMCPLVREIESTEGLESVVCLTGQHREILDQVIDLFKINVQYNLKIMQPKQTLSQITVNILNKIESILEIEKPDLILVHGDTTTSFVVALAAFYQKIPVGHVEAGLRTYNKYLPYPEEMNRTLTSKIAELHFAPTERNKINLNRENIYNNIYVTGNTVIDSFKTTVDKKYVFENKKLANIMKTQRKRILITAHRRENWGEPLQNICNAIRELAKKYTEVDFIYPVHPNPTVSTVVKEILDGIENVYLLEPIDVEEMHNLLSRSFLVLTDSGGLQEEAPFFGIPVLVLRNETERPEAVEAGCVRVIGTEKKIIVAETEKLLNSADKYHQMAHSVSPYGDGNASRRIINAIVEWKENDKNSKRSI